VWELTHHLIKRLDSSEADAASLLQIAGGGFAEQARQLAYLLFGIAERSGRAGEASTYNGLIQSWPELTRLAASQPSVVQQTLVE
jgi:putative DNA methylase